MTSQLAATFWSGENLPLVIVCVAAGFLALGFFAAIAISEFREAKRKSDAKKALERAREHFMRK